MLEGRDAIATIEARIGSLPGVAAARAKIAGDCSTSEERAATAAQLCAAGHVPIASIYAAVLGKA